jgi:hypothetical protein
MKHQNPEAISRGHIGHVPASEQESTDNSTVWIPYQSRGTEVGGRRQRDRENMNRANFNSKYLS